MENGMASNTLKKTILVTGAAGGIGRQCVARLQHLGFKVLAGVRTERDAREFSGAGTDVIPVVLDIADDASVRAAVLEIAMHLDSMELNGLVNSAGMIVEGPIDLIPMEQFRKQFDVNVLGLVSITKELLPMLIQGKGRIVNVGAISSFLTMPFYGAISSSKAAVASVSDAMRMELKPFGVEVSLVEPGALRTEIFAKSHALSRNAIESAHPDKVGRYGDAMLAFQRALAVSGASDPEVAVHAIISALTARSPKPRYRVGNGVAMALFLRRLPDRIRDRLLTGFLGLAGPLRQAAIGVRKR
jgi:NAD(P)-dependent dehydrogenase (short-subunit alcohol dehydrogenase family)